MLCKTQLVVLNRGATRRDNQNRRRSPRSPFFFGTLKGLCSRFRRERAILIRDVATRESTRGMTFATSTAAPSLLPHPFVSPLNYLRALRDWPTNPVRLNNLPIIRGPLCFIRRVSNKSHCVFRRAASNSIRVRTRTLSAYPALGEKKEDEAKKRKRKRPERSRREGRDRARFARIDSKFG